MAPQCSPAPCVLVPTKPRKEKTKEIKQARGTPGRRRTQETQGNTTQSLRALRSLRSLARCARTQGKGKQGTTEEHKGAKGTQDSTFLPKCCERPAAREQKAKENITKIPLRRLPKWYQTPPQIDQKTSQHDTKMVPKRGIAKKHKFCCLFLPLLAPPRPPKEAKMAPKVTKNL